MSSKAVRFVLVTRDIKTKIIQRLILFRQVEKSTLNRDTLSYSDVRQFGTGKLCQGYITNFEKLLGIK